MTSAKSNRRGFIFSTGTLLRAAQQLLGALQEDTFASPLVVHLSPTFVGDFTAQVALVAKLCTDQNAAIGNLSTLTLSQRDALVDFHHLAAGARRAAKLAFTGEATLLRAGFQVGEDTPRTIAAMLARGRNLLVACQSQAAELAVHNWSAASTAQLEEALATLTDADLTQEAQMDEKIGLTAERTKEANRLYRQCLALQSAARVVYANARASADPAAVEARERFLLGVFPPKRNRPGTPVATVATVSATADALVVSALPVAA